MTRCTVLVGDVLEVLRQLPPWSVDLVVTSFPYWQLRDYEVPISRWADGCEVAFGLEPDWRHYVAHALEVCSLLDQVLRASGAAYLNLGDSYSGSNNGANDHRPVDGLGNAITARRAGLHRPGRTELPDKSLIGIPYRIYLALVDELGWVWRNDSHWLKTNGRPASVRDRYWNKHEPFGFFTMRSRDYYFDLDAVRQPHAPKTLTTLGTTRRTAPVRDPKVWSRNFLAGKPRQLNPKGVVPGDVWACATSRGTHDPDHTATYPEHLVAPLILASCPPGGVVLDPFLGTGTTAAAALKLGRRAIGIEANPVTADRAERHLAQLAERMAA